MAASVPSPGQPVSSINMKRQKADWPLHVVTDTCPPLLISLLVWTVMPSMLLMPTWSIAYNIHGYGKNE
jgi:hypothetical protein